MLKRVVLKKIWSAFWQYKRKVENWNPVKGNWIGLY